MITDISGYMRGGTPTETRTLINGLVALGHSVALVGDKLPFGTTPIPLYALRLPVSASTASEVNDALNDFRPDFVHVICMSSKGAISLSSVLSKHPWALTVHSVPPYERKLSRWHGQETLHYGARALRFALNSLAWRWIFSRGLLPLIIVHSKFVQNIVIRYGAAPNTVHLIPLPFDAPNSSTRDARLGTRTQNPLLVTVAGLAHTKGQHDAVKALPGLIRIYPKIQYQMIGEVRDNGYLTYLRDLARKLRISEHLLISLDLDNPAKLTALESADVYIQPSHEEGFCLAYAEAAAIVPRLVGTDAGAIAAMSRADAGARIVPIKDPSALGAAVVELLTTDLPMNLMNLRSQRLSQEFSLERYLADHEKLYAEPRSRS